MKRLFKLYNRGLSVSLAVFMGAGSVFGGTAYAAEPEQSAFVDSTEDQIVSDDLQAQSATEDQAVPEAQPVTEDQAVPELRPSSEDLAPTAEVRSEKVGMIFKNGMAQRIPELKGLGVPEEGDFTNYTNKDYDPKKEGAQESPVLRFAVYVETDLDTDMDGKNDLVQAFVQVPRAAARGDYKAPVVYEASPYTAGVSETLDKNFGGPDTGKNLFKKVENKTFSENMLYQPGSSRVPASAPVGTESFADSDKCHSSEWFYDYKDFVIDNPDYLDDPESFLRVIQDHNYMLERGFAVVISGGIGTNGSDGLETCGSKAEAEAFKDIIEWINGKRTAYTDRVSNIPISATDWASGKVAMRGCSYDGTMAYEVATTGVEGLMTIVPECGIASWYNYSNSQGLSFQGPGSNNNQPYDYTGYLSSECASRFYGLDNTEDLGRIKDLFQNLLYDMWKNQGELKGHYGDYWACRDFYTGTVQNRTLSASALIIAGMQDYNVCSRQADFMRRAFEASGRDVRVMLSMDGHGSPEGQPINTNVGERCYDEILNRWYSYYLCPDECGQDENDNILKELPYLTAQNDLDGKFYGYDRWGYEGDEWTDDHKLLLEPLYGGEEKVDKMPLDEKKEEEENVPPASFGEGVLNPLWNPDYSLDDFYEELQSAGISSDEADKSFNAIWAGEVYDDTVINGMGVVRLRVKCEDVSGDWKALGVYLYDLSDDEFDSYEIDPDNDNMIVQTTVEEDYFGDPEDHLSLMEFKRTPVTKHLISSGAVNLDDPEAGYEPATSTVRPEPVQKDVYYDYTVYLDPKVYTVPAGHRIAIYVLPVTQKGVKSDTSFTIDNDQSFALIPVEKLPGALTEGVRVWTEVTEANDTLVSKETISVNGAGEKKEVSVTTKDVSDGKITVKNSIWIHGLSEGFIWEGRALTLDNQLEVYDGTKKLTLKKDYKLSYSNNKKVSANGKNASVTVKFLGDYKGNAPQKKEFRIDKASLDPKYEDITVNDMYVAYTGKEQKPVPEIFYRTSGILVPKSQMAVSYAPEGTENYSRSVKDAGKYTVKIEPKNENSCITGVAGCSLTVLSAEQSTGLLSKAKVTFRDNKKSFVYTNSEICPEVTVTVKGADGSTKELSRDDYDVKYEDNKNPGTARAVITSKSESYYGSNVATFRITKGRKLINDTDDKGNYLKDVPFRYYVSNAYFSLSGGKPGVTVYDGETLLREGTDYSLSYSKNKKVTGENDPFAVLTIKGKGLYSGAVKKGFVVREKNIRFMTVTADDIFGDSPDNPYIVVTDENGKKLKEGRDYTVAEKPDAENEAEGKYKIKVNGKGNYFGSVSAYYRLIKDSSKNIARFGSKKIEAQPWYGYEVKLSYDDLKETLYERNGNENVYLQVYTDFEVSYYINNRKTGTAKVVLKGSGEYGGTRTLTFKITDGNKREFLGWF